jgi:acylphosphatase
MATIGRRVLVTGLVQGVWFRQTTADVAREAGVAGWVRNLPDGRVEAVLEGEPAAVEAVVAWCHRGPRAARVDSIDITEVPSTGATGFAIRP